MSSTLADYCKRFANTPLDKGRPRSAHPIKTQPKYSSLYQTHISERQTTSQLYLLAQSKPNQSQRNFA